MIIAIPLLDVKAQFIEDALRYSINNSMITPRVGGLNYAYLGIVDDIASLKFNPAGLSLNNKYEISIGMGFVKNSIEVDFLSNKNNLNSNNEYLTHIGFSAPIDNVLQNTVLAIAYFNESDFKNFIKFDGFNTKSTFIADFARNGPRNYDDNLATFLSLADDKFSTPLIDSLNQSGYIIESGGLHSVFGGISFDLSDNFALGFTLQGKWGEYKYRRDFEEFDLKNKYKVYDPDNFTDIDFTRLIVSERIDQTLGGFSGSIGFIYKFEDILRIGGTLTLPTFYEVDEDFNQTAWAEFDNGDKSQNNYKNSGVNKYNIRTPFIYSIGASYHIYGLTLSAGLQYSDISQIQFSGRSTRLDNLNKAILEELAGQIAWGVGGELELPGIPIVIRGSYSMISSPYFQNIEGANKNIFAIGAGFYPMANLRIDLSGRYNEHTELRTNYNYGSGSQYTFKQSPWNIGLMLTYRFSKKHCKKH